MRFKSDFCSKVCLLLLTFAVVDVRDAPDLRLLVLEERLERRERRPHHVGVGPRLDCVKNRIKSIKSKVGSFTTKYSIIYV